MQKLVDHLRLAPHSQTYRVPESFYRERRERPTVKGPNMFTRIWAAILNAESKGKLL
jgi:hypothetical protein